jgi:hypothetical protein
MCITTLILGGCIMHSHEDTAVATGTLYFCGWAVLLWTALSENIVSGSLVESVTLWQAIMASSLISRMAMHRRRLWDNFRASNPRIHHAHHTLRVAVGKILDTDRLSTFFSLRNIIFTQCLVFGATALLVPEFFFKQLFFMLNEPTSPLMLFFARGLALSSLLLGGLVRNGSNEEAAKIGVVYFGSLALHAFYTCGNPISPLFAPIDSFLAIRSIRAYKSRRDDEEYCI